MNLYTHNTNTNTLIYIYYIYEYVSSSCSRKLLRCDFSSSELSSKYEWSTSSKSRAIQQILSDFLSFLPLRYLIIGKKMFHLDRPVSNFFFLFYFNFSNILIIFLHLSSSFIWLELLDRSGYKTALAIKSVEMSNVCVFVANDSWSPSRRIAGEGGQLSEFIDGLGPGQLVGRQVLGASSLGDVQLALKHHAKGYLEVEVVRARELQAKAGSKILPGSSRFLFITLHHVFFVSRFSSFFLR